MRVYTSTSHVTLGFFPEVANSICSDVTLNRLTMQDSVPILDCKILWRKANVFIYKVSSYLISQLIHS